MLKVDGLEAGYGRSQVLFGMTLAAEEGEVVSLVGRNGMGKTTTVNTLMGLLPVRRGRIGFDGADIAGFVAADVIPGSVPILANLGFAGDYAGTMPGNPLPSAFVM